MSQSDRMLLIELAERVKELTATVEDMRESQRQTQERLDATEKLLERIRKGARAQSRNVYAQVEDMQALYRQIDPPQALPRMRGWAAGPDLLRFLYEEVTGQRRSHVLECGSGVTTVVLAYAMRANGTGSVTTLEHDPGYAALTRRELKERGLEDWARIHDAPLTEVDIDGRAWQWYDRQVLPEKDVDALVVDGPPGGTGPEARYPALPLLADRLSAEALVVLDDADRPDERAITDRWLEQFPDFTLERPRHDRGTAVLRRGAER